MRHAGLRGSWTPCIEPRSYCVLFLAAILFTGAEAFGQSVLMHGADAGPTFGADGAVFDFLVEKLGAGSVTYMQGDLAAADGSSADGFTAVIISSSLGSGTVRNKYEDLALPVLNWEQALTDSSEAGDFHLSTGGRTNPSSSEIEVVDSDHFITAGLEGVLQVVDTPQTFSLGTGDVGPGVRVLANLAGSDTDHAIMVADLGAELLGDGGTGRPDVAPERRAFLFLEDTTFGALTDVGLQLVNRTVDWLFRRDLEEITPGDFNSDGAIDLADYGILVENFNTRGASFADGDMDFNLRVDLADFIVFRQVYADANPGAAVPEPSAGLLLGWGLLVFWPHYRRRASRSPLNRPQVVTRLLLL